jgi:hypothetical protein
MAEEDLVVRQCGRKAIYVGLKEARREARFLHKKLKAKFMAYQCRWCGGFHVGRLRSPGGDAARRERPLSGRRLREAARAGKDLLTLEGDGCI